MIWRDIRCAARRIARYRLAATVAILSLAAGIGSTATTLLARKAIFRNPPPLCSEPAQLARIQVTGRDGRAVRVPAPLWALWREQTASETNVALAALAPARTVEMRVDRRRAPFSIQRVTPELFALSP
jgi:hypothetical protein